MGLVDQGLFSASNLLISVLLGRWLSEEQYGAFSISFSIFLILSSVQVGLIFDPMVIYGPTRYKSNIIGYLQKLIYYQLILTSMVSLVLIVVAQYFESHLRNSFVSIAICLPFILLYWFFRQACYMQLKPEIAARSSIIYSIIIILGLFFEKNFDMLSASNGYILMGFASIISSLTTASSLKMLKIIPAQDADRAIIFTHWNYGKWLVVSNVAVALSSFIYAPILGIISGLSDAAIFKSLQNFIQPIQQLMVVINLLVLPKLSSYRTENIKPSFINELKQLFKTYLIVVSGYFILLTPFSALLLQLTYKNTLYSGFAYLIPIWGIATIISILPRTLGTLFRVYEKSDYILWAKGISVIFLLTFGMLLIKFYNLEGAVISILISVILESIFMVLLYNKISIGY